MLADEGDIVACTDDAHGVEPAHTSGARSSELLEDLAIQVLDHADEVSLCHVVADGDCQLQITAAISLHPGEPGDLEGSGGIGQPPLNYVDVLKQSLHPLYPEHPVYRIGIIRNPELSHAGDTTSFEDG